MRVKKTGAKKGQSPVWYVQADDDVERALFASEVIVDQSPDERYVDVLAWGFGDKAAAEAAAEGLEQALGSLPVDVLGTARESAVFDEDLLEVLGELQVVTARLGNLANQFHDVRLNEVSSSVSVLVDLLDDIVRPF